MRAPSLRLFAALAVTGALVAGALAGCGKGSGAGTAQHQRRCDGPPAHRASSASPRRTRRASAAPNRRTTPLRSRGPCSPASPRRRARRRSCSSNQRDWPAALAASSLAGAPLGAPLLFADGDSLPDATAQALHAMRPIGASALGGAQVIRIGTGAALPDGLRARSLAAGGEPAGAAAAVQQLRRLGPRRAAAPGDRRGLRRAARAADARSGAVGRERRADPVRRTRAACPPRRARR